MWTATATRLATIRHRHALEVCKGMNTQPRVVKPSGDEPLVRLQQLCNDMAGAVKGDLGDIVAKHEELILEYYRDVRSQATGSFAAARMVASIGFGTLIATVAYALIFDALTRFKVIPPPIGNMTMTIANVGLISGALIEFIAAIAFWLYSRTARQFGAFHICLERTHRYLLAYKIAHETGEGHEATLRDIACIMANAPMIGRTEFESATLDQASARTAKLTTLSTKVTPP
jgi:hypothetical protein